MEKTRKIRKTAAWILCLAAVFLLFLFLNHSIGLPASGLEADLRKSQKIREDWKTYGSITDSMAAFISCPVEGVDHTFSVYVNRPGLSFGYFFRGGGDISQIERSIAAFRVEGYDQIAYLSLNAPKAAYAEVDTGDFTYRIHLDREKPFALVFPKSEGVICFYNEKEEPLEYRELPL